MPSKSGPIHISLSSPQRGANIAYNEARGACADPDWRSQPTLRDITPSACWTAPTNGGNHPNVDQGVIRKRMKSFEIALTAARNSFARIIMLRFSDRSYRNHGFSP
jgi:hypothetical protein